jgi:hypothetical protein
MTSCACWLSNEVGSRAARSRARTIHEPVHRGILGVDIERYSRAEWTDPIRARLRRRLYRLVAGAMADAGIEPAWTTRSDTGDGLWLLVAAQVSTARLLHPLAVGLVRGAAEDNERVAELEHLRLRVVVHAGDVIPDPQGQAGASIIHAGRLLDADATRAVLGSCPEAAGVIVTSDAVYDGIVRHAYPGIDPSDWQPVRIEAKETSARAWVHLPGLAEQPRMHLRERSRAPHLSLASPPAVDVKSASAILSALPTETSSNPGPLPGGSRTVLARNPLFVDRAADLRRIATILKGGSGSAPARVVAITGICGSGKTQLAAEFVHRYGRYFTGGVFWLSFANASEIESQVAACGGPGFMQLRPHFGELRLEDRVAIVRSAWQAEVPRLLVFDNCEAEELFVRWCPPTGGCRVVVTTRRGSWSPVLGVEALPLNVLNRTQSRLLLSRFRPELRCDDRMLDGIAHELGDLPLALHLAGSFLRRYQAVMTPERYLAELRELGPLQHASLQGRGWSRCVSPTGHAQSIAEMFRLTCEQLRNDSRVDQAARTLLATASCMAPGELVPRTFLVRHLGEAATREDQLQREDAFIRLQDLGLLEASGDSVRVHRLLAQFVRGTAFDGSCFDIADEMWMNAS